MALSAAVKAEIAEAVKAGMAGSSCECGLSEAARGEVSHFFGMIKDVGDGDYSKGVENVRAGLKILQKFRWASEKVGGAVLIALGAAIFALVGISVKPVGTFLKSLWR
jgi:hypothetical protein